MDTVLALKLKIGLRGTHLQIPSKLNLNVLKFAKLKKKQQMENDQQSPPIMNVAPSSLSKFPRKLTSISRQSTQSRKMIKNQIKLSEELESTNHTTQSPDVRQQKQQIKNDFIKQNMKDKIDIQSQLRKISVPKARKCGCGNCEECLKDFNHFLNICWNDKSLPQISAKSWCIWKRKKNQKFTYYFGKRIHKTRQIASLTKMITAMAAIDFLKQHQYDENKVTWQIRKSSTTIGGTTANLQVGQIYTINQLLYAMMLPSGNDAAIAIAEAIGFLHNLKLKNKHVNPHNQGWLQQWQANSSKSFGFYFVALMNQKCQKIGLLDTRMYNSHGNDAFDQVRNISTCNQVAKISVQYTQKYQHLKQISNTKTYRVDRFCKKWENTNKLLEDGFQGIKTGINQSSGPCLAAYYRDFIIVVLNSKSMNQRWVEVKKLVRWIIRKSL